MVCGIDSASGYRGLYSKPKMTTRRFTPICGAASPAPSSAPIVSHISVINWSSSGVSNCSTRLDFSSNLVSPIFKTVFIAIRMNR